MHDSIFILINYLGIRCTNTWISFLKRGSVIHVLRAVRLNYSKRVYVIPIDCVRVYLQHCVQAYFFILIELSAASLANFLRATPMVMHFHWTASDYEQKRDSYEAIQDRHDRYYIVSYHFVKNVKITF